MKIGIISSEGGHLIEALNLLDSFEGNQMFSITYDVPHIKDFRDPRIQKTYFVGMGKTTFRLFFRLFFSTFKFIRIFIKERPKILFSTGSEIAIPAFYISKILFGTKLIFMETIAKFDEPSLTGRFVYPVTDLFFVPWESLLCVYGKKAVFVGEVI